MERIDSILNHYYYLSILIILISFDIFKIKLIMRNNENPLFLAADGDSPRLRLRFIQTRNEMRMRIRRGRNRKAHTAFCRLVDILADSTCIVIDNESYSVGLNHPRDVSGSTGCLP